MSKKSFLIPTAIAVAGLLATTQASAAVQPISEINLIPQTSATVAVNSLAQNPFNSLTLNKASTSRQYAWHSSHASHASHASHYSSR
jgi:hypothetical protein